MEEQFVTFPIAEKLKELGFDEPCLGVFGLYSKELLISEASKGLCNADHELILAPLWQQVLQWLREKHNVYFHIDYKPAFEKYAIHFQSPKIESPSFIRQSFDTYEEALKTGILEALKLIKTNDNEIN